MVLWLTFVLSFNIILVASGIVHIFQLQSKIALTNAENIKLLDGMHEGVLILTKDGSDIIFMNKPAQNLL